MMRLCHFSRNDRTALCGVSVADMCTDTYTSDSLDLVTCEMCREILYPEPSRIPSIWCICRRMRTWTLDGMVQCPGCGELCCADCFPLHRRECSNVNIIGG